MNTYYLIRNKHTHEWLPQFSGRQKTHTELSKTKPPRLFHRVADAKTALTWWLQGVVKHTCSPGTWEYDVVVKPVESRVAEEMEIIPVSLLVGTDWQQHE